MTDALRLLLAFVAFGGVAVASFVYGRFVERCRWVDTAAREAAAHAAKLDAMRESFAELDELIEASQRDTLDMSEILEFSQSDEARRISVSWLGDA